MRRLLLVVILTGLLFVGFGTPLVNNLWDVVTGSGAFEIPIESSVWRFRVTRMNLGSGENWLFGEDSARFYQNMDDGKVFSITRQEAGKLNGFDPQDVATWPVREI